MATVQSPAEQRMVLRNISWDTFQRLLHDAEDRIMPRLTYDRGTLELMSPLPLHEHYTRSLQLLVPIAAAELGVDVYSVGSATFTREDLQRGFEADCSFYIRHAPLVRGKDRIDLSVDPPPDLVAEIDITRSTVSKLDIYAQFGVPEVWRFDGEHLRIYVQSGVPYTEVAESHAMPGIPAESLAALLERSAGLYDTQWISQVSEWARRLRSP